MLNHIHRAQNLNHFHDLHTFMNKYYQDQEVKTYNKMCISFDSLNSFYVYFSLFAICHLIVPFYRTSIIQMWYKAIALSFYRHHVAIFERRKCSNIWKWNYIHHTGLGFGIFNDPFFFFSPFLFFFFFKRKMFGLFFSRFHVFHLIGSDIRT